MQVSWIDADQIRALVAQIAPLEKREEEALGVIELDTTPVTVTLPESAAQSWGFAMDWSEAAARPAPTVMETALAAAEPPKPQVELEDEMDDDGHGHPLHNPAAALPLSRIRDKLRAIRQRASEAGILTRPSEAVPPPEPVIEKAAAVPAPVDPEEGDAAKADLGKDEPVPETTTKTETSFAAVSPEAPAFDIPHGPRDVRLAAFADWARQVLREDGGHVLVMSDDGEVLWGGEAKAGLVLSTMMAWGAAIRASAMAACETPPVIHQPLASGNVLTVIPCETKGGMVHAAVAAPVGLTQDQAHVLRGALCAAMN